MAQQLHLVRDLDYWSIFKISTLSTFPQIARTRHKVLRIVNITISLSVHVFASPCSFRIATKYPANHGSSTTKRYAQTYFYKILQKPNTHTSTIKSPLRVRVPHIYIYIERGKTAFPHVNSVLTTWFVYAASSVVKRKSF